MNIVAACVVVTALFAYVNRRFVGFPATIGVMAISLAVSAALVGLNGFAGSGLRRTVLAWLSSVDFSAVLMQGMLSFLLFAGALHLDVAELRRRRGPVALLALAGTVMSSVIIGYAVYVLLPLWGMHLPATYCLIFGALISPTDPIAVLGMLKSAAAPRSLEVVMAGESLFNDGIGVVLFAMFGTALATGSPPSVADAVTLFVREALGGVLFGLMLGLATDWLLRSIDSYAEEVLITLAAVVGGYALANAWHTSGPLAMVVAGIIVGHHLRRPDVNHVSRDYLEKSWELIDVILNSILFVLLGMEVVLISFPPRIIGPALAVIFATLAARWLTVITPLTVLRRRFDLPSGSGLLLTWGGLRGGISVALALSLPAGPDRNVVLALTYAVVVFSILVQGLSMKTVTRRILGPGAGAGSGIGA
jgi:monovalent cation:H+ antiporter, CPA1 family